jgi:hypothetical protein
VLKLADEQVIAAVESGDAAVSDAAAIANRPKEEQRRALEVTRQGRARTLRQAADLEDGGNSPAEGGKRQGDGGARRRMGNEVKTFARELDKLLLRLNALTSACGGGNQHTDRMRACLRRLIDHFREFVGDFLPAEKECGAKSFGHASQTFPAWRRVRLESRIEMLHRICWNSSYLQPGQPKRFRSADDVEAGSEYTRA